MGQKDLKNTTPPNKRALQKSQTREVILKTAKDLFLKQGYEKTTVRNIAAKACISSGTVFSHFPDKTSLLIATLHKDMDDVITKSYRPLTERDSLIDVITNNMRAVYRHFAKTPELSRTWIKESLFAEGPYGDLLQSQLEHSTRMVQSLLRNAQKLGRIRATSDCEILAEAIMAYYYNALVIGIWNRWKANQQVRFFKRLTRNLLEAHVVDDRAR